MPKILRDSMRVGLLLSVPALIAWLTGRPFIFPSLGPSAFTLVMDGPAKNPARRVIGGHLIGIIGGFLAYHLLANGCTLVALPRFMSFPLLCLVASGVCSVVLTTAGMCVARTQHTPACATTLIVSLGLMATFRDAIFIMLAVSAMYATFRLLISAKF